MSAFYALAHDDRVEIAVDGAIYKSDGTLTDIRRKVWASNFIPLAITGRGSCVAVEGVARALLTFGALGTFDAAIDAIGGALQKRSGEYHGEAFELVIAGVSETNGPSIYYTASGDVHSVGIKPFNLIKVGNELGGGSPITTEELASISRQGKTLHDVAVPLFEAMRAKKGSNPADPSAPEVYGIGGHLDLATVTADGVTIERIHEWPDEIGQKINPHPMMDGAALIAHLEKHGSIEIFN